MLAPIRTEKHFWVKCWFLAKRSDLRYCTATNTQLMHDKACNTHTYVSRTPQEIDFFLPEVTFNSQQAMCACLHWPNCYLFCSSLRLATIEWVKMILQCSQKLEGKGSVVAIVLSHRTTSNWFCSCTLTHLLAYKIRMLQHNFFYKICNTAWESLRKVLISHCTNTVNALSPLNTWQVTRHSHNRSNRFNTYIFKARDSFPQAFQHSAEGGMYAQDSRNTGQ